MVVSAPGHFSFGSCVLLVLGHFSPPLFPSLVISVQGHFGPYHFNLGPFRSKVIQSQLVSDQVVSVQSHFGPGSFQSQAV